MKKSILLGLFSLLVLLSANGQTYTVQTSEFTISGTSSLHDWESEVTQVSLRGGFFFADEELTSIKNLSVRIPVEGIKSTKGRVMDNKTYDAFNSDEYPNIVFNLTGITLPTDAANPCTITARGNLTMAGTSQSITLQVSIERLDNGRLVVEGSKSLLMSSFGMDPPTALLGTLKTGDEVTIHFSLTLVEG